MLALGGFAYEACCRLLGVTKRPAFGHGVEVPTESGISIVCSYHPSQQNTFTGRLTEEMLDAAVGALGRSQAGSTPGRLEMVLRLAFHCQLRCTSLLSSALISGA